MIELFWINLVLLVVFASRSFYLQRKVNRLEKEAETQYSDKVRSFYRVNNRITHLGVKIMDGTIKESDLLKEYKDMNAFVIKELYPNVY